MWLVGNAANSNISVVPMCFVFICNINKWLGEPILITVCLDSRKELDSNTFGYNYIELHIYIYALYIGERLSKTPFTVSK